METAPIPDMEDVYMSDEVKALLIQALNKLYFSEPSQEEDGQSKLNLIISVMQREEVDEGVTIIQEGESGSKLFIIESGELDVSINGDFIRTMSSGNMIGELALLYDAPRSATIKCKNLCVLWSLQRAIFKKIQASEATRLDRVRAKFLSSCPTCSKLSEFDLSRLVSNLRPHHFNNNCMLFEENENTNQIVLIESGLAQVYTTYDMSSMTASQVDIALGICRPNSEEKPGPAPSTTKSQYGYLSSVIYRGCLVGHMALMSKKGMETPAWHYSKEVKGSKCPATFITQDGVMGLLFSIGIFENLFGPISASVGNAASNKLPQIEPGKQKEMIKFDTTKFKMKFVYGSGSFGVVIAADYKNTDTNTITSYALKALSKSAVVETGQLRHLLDESNTLKNMDHQFIVKLFGIYQTHHQLVMVTEPLMNGDLWNVIYNTIPYIEQKGLPLSLALFYTSNIAFALAYIHSKGIVFRDLKPENIMMDNMGYIRIIDFGFAKKVPYSKVESNGVSRVYAKTYTLCGTPEYLAPELIFNFGHDKAVDIWALGVIFYEMIIAATPFAAAQSSNMTDLFTNIAMVKKLGLTLTAEFHNKIKSKKVESFIFDLLVGEPTLRLGIKSGNSRDIVDHEIFASLDVDSVENMTYVPEYIGPKLTDFEGLQSLQNVKPYKGDQSIFAAF